MSKRGGKPVEAEMELSKRSPAGESKSPAQECSEKLSYLCG